MTLPYRAGTGVAATDLAHLTSDPVTGGRLDTRSARGAMASGASTARAALRRLAGTGGA